LIKPGFEAELLAAKLLGTRAPFPQRVQRASPQPQAEVVLRQPAAITKSTPKSESTFQQYYQQNFTGNAICKRAMEELYSHFRGNVSGAAAAEVIVVHQEGGEEKGSVIQSYAPRQQARAYLYLQDLEIALSGTTKKEVVQDAEQKGSVTRDYAPRHQASAYLYLENLEKTLSGTKKEADQDEVASVKFCFKPSVGTWMMKPPIMLEQQQASTLVNLEVPTPKEDVASHCFRLKPSVGTWVMQPPVVIKQEQAYQYVPRHQAAASAYLEQLETSLKEPKTVAASEDIAQQRNSFNFKPSVGTWVMQPPTVIKQEQAYQYVPRHQAAASAYLEQLETSLKEPKTVAASEEIAQHYTPRFQAQAHVYLEKLEQSLRGTNKEEKPSETVQVYVPRHQATRHDYFEKLESSLSRTDSEQKEEKVPTMTRDAPKVCLSSSVLYGPSFWSAGLRPMPFFC